MKTQIIIVAGGKGQRMQTEIAKQFLLLDDKPILMHTIERFLDFSSDLFLVLPEHDIPTWQDLVVKHQFDVPVKIVTGGKERFFSVKNALDEIEEQGIVLIHDGVRPFVSKQCIESVIHQTAKGDSAIPVMDINESIRCVENDQSKSVDRNQYKTVQTPQGFNTKMIKEAYRQNYTSLFTDDASVFESADHQINLVEGNKENIKITSPEDLHLANYLIKHGFSL